MTRNLAPSTYYVTCLARVRRERGDWCEENWSCDKPKSARGRGEGKLTRAPFIRRKRNAIVLNLVTCVHSSQKKKRKKIALIRGKEVGITWHDMNWQDMLWHDMTRLNEMVWHVSNDMTWYGITLRHKTWHPMVRHHMTWCDMEWPYNKT